MIIISYQLSAIGFQQSALYKVELSQAKPSCAELT